MATNELTNTNVAAVLLRERHQIARLGEVRREVQQALAEAEADGDTLVASFVRGAGLQSIREAFTPELIAAVSQMAGHALTFKTDRDETTRDGRPPYPPEVIRDCVIQALLEGVELQGNQFSILGGSCYLTQAGYHHKLLNHPAISDFGKTIGMPEDARPHGKEVLALLPCRAWAVVNGKRIEVDAVKVGEFDDRIAVTAYRGDPDAMKGKATRRIYQRLWEKITGQRHVGQDIPEDIEADGSVRVIDPKDKFAVWREEFKTRSESARQCATEMMRATTRDDVARLAELRENIEAGYGGGTLDQRDTNSLRKFMEFCAANVTPADGHTGTTPCPQVESTTTTPEPKAKGKNGRKTSTRRGNPAEPPNATEAIRPVFKSIEQRLGADHELSEIFRDMFTADTVAHFDELNEQAIAIIESGDSGLTDADVLAFNEYTAQRFDELATF